MNGFVELNELKYNGGGYATYPLLIGLWDIASVGYDRSGYVDGTMVYLASGREYRVQESYTEVIKRMREAME